MFLFFLKKKILEKYDKIILVTCSEMGSKKKSFKEKGWNEKRDFF